MAAMEELLAIELLVSLTEDAVVVDGGSRLGCSVGFLGVWSVIHPLLVQNLRNQHNEFHGTPWCPSSLTTVQGPLIREERTSLCRMSVWGTRRAEASVLVDRMGLHRMFNFSELI